MKKFFTNLFRREKPPEERKPEELVTAPLSAEQLNDLMPEGLPPMPSLEPPQLIAGCGQSVGRQRGQNQDTIFAFSSLLAGEKAQIPIGVYIVADGMGGHEDGDLASETACRVMGEYILQHIYLPLLHPNQEPPEQSLQEILQIGIQEANKAIHKATPNGGTTLTVAVILGRQLTIAHVGDSRAYLVTPQDGLELLTRDHSMVNRLVEMGQLTPAEASEHPQRNVLYRAMGQGDPLEAEIETHKLPSGGYILLCSDGLWGVVNASEIQRIINAGPNPAEICQNLVAAANQGGGPDNISAILVQLPH
ncbi:MAG: protein phosphatase 2C domain-containing protein [Anaerolineales bacterium]